MDAQRTRHMLGRGICFPLVKMPVGTKCAHELILAKADIFPNPNVNTISDFLRRRAGDRNRTLGAGLALSITLERHRYGQQPHASHLRDPYHPEHADPSRHHPAQRQQPGAQRRQPSRRHHQRPGILRQRLPGHPRHHAPGLRRPPPQPARPTHRQHRNNTNIKQIGTGGGGQIELQQQ